jgi:hypothetical protein|tara:strand:+ start:653 stop:796 length:144 start_codon:yes stop_codon:yes gene_type:complete
MDFDKAKHVDIEMSFMAGSLQFLRKDLRAIQDKLRHERKGKKEKKDG